MNDFDNFIVEYVKLCEKYKIELTPSHYDQLQAWRIPDDYFTRFLEEIKHIEDMTDFP